MTNRPKCLMLALLATSAIAFAQPLQCSANAANSATLRSTSLAEPTSDVILTCTGGTPTPFGQTVPAINFTLTSNATVTSRLLASPWSEALLLVDEPVPLIQSACTVQNAACVVQGVGSGTGTYNGTAGHPNIFQGSQVSSNSIAFLNIPLDPTGTGTPRIFRFTNLKVNATSVAVGSSVTFSITASPTLTITNSLVTVGTTQNPVNVTARSVQTGANGVSQFGITFIEGFPYAFKTRTTAVDPLTSPQPVNQNNTGQFFPGVETVFYNNSLGPVPGRGNLSLAGLADTGTRFILLFSGIPAGIQVAANLSVPLGGSGSLRVVSTDSSGAGPFLSAGQGIFSPDQNGTVTVVYEVLNADPLTIERADLTFLLIYSVGAPQLNSISVSAGLAPISRVGSTDQTAPLPRFSALSNLQISTLGISPTSIPQGSVNVPYSQLFTATGGIGPYNWTASNLPPGLMMSTSGILNGAPTTIGNYLITVTVTDATLSSASVQLGLVVANGFIITTTAVPNGTVGVPYSTTILTSGATGNVTMSVSPSTLFGQSILPPGLSLAPGGSLTGTPISAGTFGFTVLAMDQGGHQYSQRFTMVIAPALVLQTTSPIGSGVAGGGNYAFTFTATGGTPPYNFTIDTPPPGLLLTPRGLLTGSPTAAGTFVFNVTVTDGQQVSVTKKYQVSFAAAPSLLQVSSTQLNFSALLGADPPPPQTLQVTTSSVAPVTFSVLLDSGTQGSAVPRWLSVQTLTGTTPSAILVFVDQSSLVVGTADARIRLTVPNDATRLPIDIAVHLDIAPSGAPRIDSAPALLRFRSNASSPSVISQTLQVRNIGGSGNVGFSTAVLQHSSWITGLSLASGQTVFNNTVPVTITVNTQGLNAGVYRDVVRIAGGGTSVDVPVSLFVAGTGPILHPDTRGVHFSARQGAGSSFTQTVRVLNTGDPGSLVNWQAEVITGNEWLTITPTRSTSTNTQPGTLTLGVSTNAAGLPVGQRWALVRLSDALSGDSPQYITAALDIAPSTAAAQPDLDGGFVNPGTLLNSFLQITPSPIRVFTSSSTPVNFQASAQTDDGGTWLQVSPTSNSASTFSNGIVNVTVNPAGLSGGIHKGQINVSMGTSLRTKDVTLVIRPAIGCVSTKLAVALGNLSTNFDVIAGTPVVISARVSDDCLNGIPNASVVATFSNGDPSLTLAGDGISNTYVETWQPSSAASNMSVTLRVSAPAFPPAVIVLTGTVEAGTAPVLNRGGIVSNLNPRLDAPLAPGDVVQLFGFGLAAQTVSPPNIPLLTSVGGTSVLVGVQQVPLFYVSAGQINAELPTNLTVGSPQSVIVSNNGTYSLPDEILITALDPGVATSAGNLIAQHADSSLVDPGHPAKPGETLVMYLVGMGATNPVGVTGAPAPGLPLAPAVVQPTVMVGGQTATVLFAGLTPGGIGLYQINFIVPPTARSGLQGVSIQQNDAVANASNLIVAP